MGMTGFYGKVDVAEALRTLERAVERGATFWDSLDAYGPHTNEELLGRVLARHRPQVFVATKFGITIDPVTRRRTVDGSPATVRRSCEASLRRLGTDWLDLYYPHRVDPTTPVEEAVATMADLVAEGKIRYIGLSEPGPETIRRAHRTAPITAVQIEYSLWTRDVAAAIFPVVWELGIGLVAYGPLGHGFLPGRHRSHADLSDGDFRRNHHLAAIDMSLAPARLAEMADTLPDAMGERYDPAGMRTVGL